MNDKINQDTINKALWAACDTFRGTISADTYKDFILTMLFLKYISDVWQDHYDEYKKQYGDAPELIEAMMANERFVLPKNASFYALYERRHEPGNGERIDQALHAIEEANGTKLKMRWCCVRFCVKSCRSVPLWRVAKPASYRKKHWIT